MNGGYQAAIGDVVGMVAGHAYYFLQDVLPREMYHPTGKGSLVAPRIL
jgi:Derlin-2/3